MSSEALGQGGIAAVAVAAPNAAAHSDPTLSAASTDARCSALEEQNRQLSVQVEMLQLQFEQLKRQMQEMAARLPAGATTAAASPPIPAAALCTLRQQSTPSLAMQLSIGQQLHKDALHCVLAFLSLTELPTRSVRVAHGMPRYTRCRCKMFRSA
jgi:hypothetical protein